MLASIAPRPTSWLGVAAAMAIAGCTATDADGIASAVPEGESSRMCNAASVQTHVGQTVTEDLGATILTGSNARSLRWGPPRSAWRMDYRQNRVNVQYDEKMVITAITCG